MSKVNNEDYIFNLNWQDRYRNTFRVGILAEIDEFFYFVIRDYKHAESAYKKGFIGISGFKPGEIYRSSELFDFFKSRILEKDSKDPCKELVTSKGVSMTDSFSLEEVPDSMRDKYKKIILNIYELHSQRMEPQEGEKSGINVTPNRNVSEYKVI